jgi:DNA-binding response OmpR family regulator
MSKTLLLADDSVTIQRVVELTFAHEDVRVVSIGDGDRVMQWLDADRPDLVLVDVAIPEVDGYAIAEHVKTTKRLKGVPVLLMAGAFEPVDEARSRRIGCDGVIVKPFEPQQLVDRVKELLSSNGHGRGHEEKAAPDLPHPDRRKQPPTPEGLRKVMTMPAGGPSIEELQRESRMKTTELPPAEAPAASHAPVAAPAPVPAPTSSLPSLESLQARQVEAQSRGETWTPSTEPPAPPTPIELELPDRPFWHSDPSSVAPPAPSPVPPAPVPPVQAAPPPAQSATPKVTLVNAFTALLAAEKSTTPVAPEPPAAQAQAVSDAAVEDAVRRALVRMTDELVRRIVLETAERLIKEEIEKIKADPE